MRVRSVKLVEFCLPSSRAGSGPAAAVSAALPPCPPYATTLVPAVGILVRLLGDEAGRSWQCRILFVVLVFVLGVGFLLVHLFLEVGEIGPVEEGVALDRDGRAAATLSAAFVALGGLLLLVGSFVVVDFVVERGIVVVSRIEGTQSHSRWQVAARC